MSVMTMQYTTIMRSMVWVMLGVVSFSKCRGNLAAVKRMILGVMA